VLSPIERAAQCRLRQLDAAGSSTRLSQDLTISFENSRLHLMVFVQILSRMADGTREVSATRQTIPEGANKLT
jgi:hypothetical protein